MTSAADHLTPNEQGRAEVRIPMGDGVGLAATLYLPDPELGPQPCILEALPYRKDDLTSSYRPDYVRLRDGHGYAVCRLDLRGTGSSGGLATDEYPPQEQRDLATVLTWLAAQEWCDGNLGMYGTSYSGFNALQMACERPPELKAVIAIYASDDRYTDDVHYRGGALKFLDLVDYCHYMTPMNALPPVPEVWGPGWREEWHRRIADHEPWLLTWLREQHDGDYWRHGSVRPSYDRIAIPTMVVAGWADGYRNNSFRMMERLRRSGVPHRLVAGPWAHAATETSLPGPRIDSLPLMVAWWDRWLRGLPNGVDDGLGAADTADIPDAGDTVNAVGPESAGSERVTGEPAASPELTVFVRASTRPQPDLDTCRGEWLREQWPSPRSETVELQLEGRPALAVNPAVGTAAWIDCAGHLPWGQSLDQRYDDDASVSWDFDLDAARGPDTGPQDESLTLLGHPVAQLLVSADAPVATCSVKLCDVFPDGTSALVTRGTLNLTHRVHDATGPKELVPGEVYDVEVELDACAYRFEPGQRLRVSVAGSDWPNTSAPPRPLSLTVHEGRLRLPRWSGTSPYAPPQLAPPPDGPPAESGDGVTWSVERDVLARRTRCLVDHGSTYEIPGGGEASEHYRGTVTVRDADFAQVAHAETTFELRWPDVRAVSRASMDLTADADAYTVAIALEALEDGAVVATREWHERIPRLLG
ncbi:MAG: CocE/NonD family hydrolase [Nocardioidaceae bacterium]